MYFFFFCHCQSLFSFSMLLSKARVTIAAAAVFAIYYVLHARQASSAVHRRPPLFWVMS